ncbi:MAG: hypothetical protein ACOH12_05895 [Parvibaculaceae bacterium]
MTDAPSEAFQAWQKFVDSLAEAGRRMEQSSVALSPDEQADGFRALARALSNQLGRLEVDDAQPELAPFNLWRSKFYMDNPDCLYWVAEIAGGGCYRIDGLAGHAAFTSINVYAGAGLEAQTVARVTSDDLQLDADGRFSLTLGGNEADAQGQWVSIPQGANMVWVRQFYDDQGKMNGTCSIHRLDKVAPPPMIEPRRFARRLANTGTTLDRASKVIARSASDQAEPANSIREWSEMQGGAVYTEPGIHYQRGAWSLKSGEALLIEGTVVEARHRSVLLYSRFLNSLDYRNRPVSLAGPRFVTDADGRFRIIIAGENPGLPNWLDTEGRAYGLYVIRWLQPAATPVLPTVRVVSLADLKV